MYATDICWKYPPDSQGNQKPNPGMQVMTLQLLKTGFQEIIAQLAFKIFCYCLGIFHHIRKYTA